MLLHRPITNEEMMERSFTGEPLNPLEFAKQLIKVVRNAKILELIDQKAGDPRYQKQLRGNLREKAAEISYECSELIKALEHHIERSRNVLTYMPEHPIAEAIRNEMVFMQQLVRELMRLMEIALRIKQR